MPSSARVRGAPVSASESTRWAPTPPAPPRPVRGRPCVPKSLRVKCVSHLHTRSAWVPGSPRLYGWDAPHPPKRTASASRSSRFGVWTLPSSHPPPNVVGAEEPFHSSLPWLPLSLSGTEKARKAPRAPSESPRSAGAAAASAPPPGAARPPARPLASPGHTPRRLAGPGRRRPSATLARPCPAPPRRARTAAEASHRSASPEPGAAGSVRGRRGWAAGDALSPLLSAARPHLVALVGLERADRRLGELHMQYGDVVLSQPPARQPVPLLFPQTRRRRRPPRRHLKLPGVPPPTPLGLQPPLRPRLLGRLQPPPQLRPSRC